MDAIELLKKARAGDRQARDRMVEENVGLVWNIVKRFNGRGYDPEDLFQIGSIGLLKAIDRFDTAYEVKFSTMPSHSSSVRSVVICGMMAC